MSEIAIFISFLLYTAILFLISFITAGKGSNETFFLGNRKSPWFVVAYGMIGASLSGVTFISVPGWVNDTAFSYLVMVFGYVMGYIVIAYILLPLYYRLNLTSIYTYLENRFGFWSYKTGAFYFLVSRIIGASLRMFVVINVLQVFVFDSWNIPFWATVLIFMFLINLYTFRGGIKTIVWTDTLQTTFMLTAVIVSVFVILKHLDANFFEMIARVWNSDYSQLFITDINHPKFFLKQFVSGAFITIVMTGLDQDMMQKNLSCKTLGDSQKNMISLGFILILVNLFFLFLGAMLFLYAGDLNINLPEESDELFPLLALKYLGPFAGIVFIIGLISAAYSSADSALTSLTTSFSIDFLKLGENEKLSEKQKINIRHLVHFCIALVLIGVIIFYNMINDEAIIDKIFTIAGYTYGPLLGLYAFGLFTNYKLKDRFLPVIAVLSPVLCYFLSVFSKDLLFGYNIGFELLIINGLLTFLGCLLIKK